MRSLSYFFSYAKPEITNEDIQEAYEVILSNGAMKDASGLLEFTGVKPVITKN